MTAHTLNRHKRPKRQDVVQYLPEQSPQQSSPRALQNSFLVIGYGNELRGDDAVGAQVARRVDSWQLPEVRAITACQLTDDLTTEIANVDYVIFVDACNHKSCARSVQVKPLASVANRTRYFLSANPLATNDHSAQGLLTLTYTQYGYAPQAWLIQVPVESFELGDALSSTAQHGVDDAVQTIERFFMNYQVIYSSS